MKLLRLLAAAVVFGWSASPLAYAAPITIDDFETPEVHRARHRCRPRLRVSNHRRCRMGMDQRRWERRSLRGPTVSSGGTPQTLFDGDQAVELEMTGTFIERPIATAPGQLYDLTFHLASFVEPGSVATSFLGVGINGGALVPFNGNSSPGRCVLSVVLAARSFDDHPVREHGSACRIRRGPIPISTPSPMGSRPSQNPRRSFSWGPACWGSRRVGDRANRRIRPRSTQLTIRPLAGPPLSCTMFLNLDIREGLRGARRAAYFRTSWRSATMPLS